jgi:uncharacterized membrane protein
VAVGVAGVEGVRSGRSDGVGGRAGRGFERAVLGVLLVLVALGCAARFVDLDAKFWFYDEAVTALRVSGYTTTEAHVGLAGKTLSPAGFLVYQRVDPQHGVLDTVRSLAYNDPQHPPVFFVAARLWAGAVGTSISSLRALAALFGVCCVLSMYWLGRELFTDRVTPLAIAALTALAPVEVLYSQIAREYSLWGAAAAASSAAFLRAVRRGSLWTWSVYTVLLAIGLLIYPLTVFVAGAHLAFALSRRSAVRGRLKPLLASIAAAFVLFLPWVYEMVKHRGVFASGTDWTKVATPFGDTIRVWLVEAGLPFVDNPGLSGPFSAGTLLLALLTAALVVTAFAHLWIRGPRGAALFASFLVGTIAPFAAADLVLGGDRSLIPRFVLPALLGLEIPVAFLISNLVRSTNWRPRAAGLVILAAVITATSISYARSVGAAVWWDDDDGVAAVNVAVARLLAHTPHARLISDGNANALELSHYLSPNTQILVTHNLTMRTLLPSRQTTLVYGSPDSDSGTRLANAVAAIDRAHPGTLKPLHPALPCCDSGADHSDEQLWKLTLPTRANPPAKAS